MSAECLQISQKEMNYAAYRGMILTCIDKVRFNMVYTSVSRMYPKGDDKLAMDNIQYKFKIENGLTKVKLKKEKGLSHNDAFHTPLPGANDRTWISTDIFELTDEDGFFTDYDGTRSRVVHQWDRAGQPLVLWMNKQAFLNDNI